MGVRGGEAGGSAGHPARGWGGGEQRPQHSTRTRADFPCGSGSPRALGKPPSGDQQLTAGAPPAGAVARPSVDWQAIDWQQAHPMVRRLQARLVKATAWVHRGEPASIPGCWQGVSGMQGNLPVSF
jgi:hypothetical protein